MNEYTNPLTDIVDRARMIARSIVSQQKEQRAQPYVNDLEQLGSQYGTADPNTQVTLNERANQARADYVAKGGSPIDLPKELWGSNPSQGFQTGQGQFAPGYSGDNLSIGQKIAQAPITGRFEGRKTLPALIAETQMKHAYDQLAAQIANNQMDYNATMAGVNESKRYHDLESGQKGAENLLKIWGSTGTAPEGISGVVPGTKLYDKVAERKNDMETALKLAVQDPRYLGAQTPEEKQQIVNEIFNMIHGTENATVPSGQSYQATTGIGPYYNTTSPILSGGVSDQDILNMTKSKK